VVELYDVLDNPDKQKLYMVLEFCHSTLEAMLKGHRGPNRFFPPHQAQFYFVQLLDGLEYLFAQGVVHRFFLKHTCMYFNSFCCCCFRDIKPSNLLVSQDLVLKISDFGVAETLSPGAIDDVYRSSAGSPAIQPPEVAAGAEFFYARKVDIWGAGVTLYNLLTGTYPFDGDFGFKKKKIFFFLNYFVGENVFHLFENIAKAEFTIPTSVPREAADLIRAMLRKDPLQRAAMPEIRAHEWVRSRLPRDAAAEIPLVLVPLMDLHAGPAHQQHQHQILDRVFDDDDDDIVPPANMGPYGSIFQLLQNN